MESILTSIKKLLGIPEDCVDFDTGRERWTSQVSGNIRVAPSVVNGCIYYTEESGTIIKLS